MFYNARQLHRKLQREKDGSSTVVELKKKKIRWGYGEAGAWRVTWSRQRHNLPSTALLQCRSKESEKLYIESIYSPISASHALPLSSTLPPRQGV